MVYDDLKDLLEEEYEREEKEKNSGANDAKDSNKNTSEEDLNVIEDGSQVS